MADFSIDVKGLDQLEQLLKTVAVKVGQGMSDMLDQMLKDGEAYAINELGHIDTGETLDSISCSKTNSRPSKRFDISGYRDHGKGIIVAGGNAIWIEFGTGVAKNPTNDHPLVVDSPVPIYSHGGYGQHKGANPNGWYYYGKDGKLHHTQGIEANMFLYHTYEALVDDLPDYAKEFVRKALGK